MSSFFAMGGDTDVEWGDYGHILTHGMGDHLPRESACLQLERTGPFVPPVSFPAIGSFVVTTDCLVALQGSGLDRRHVSFRPVIKRHIVELDWRSWDLTADEPSEYPDGGEPEDYVLSRPHSPTLAARMGNLWEVVVAPAARVQRSANPRDYRTPIRLIGASWTGGDIFGAESVAYLHVTERARERFAAHGGKWVDLSPAPTA